jgi:hypothetical protein
MRTKRKILWLLAVILLAAGGTLKAEWSEPFYHHELNDQDDTISATDPFLSDDGLTIYYSRHRWHEDTYDLAEAYRDTPEGPFTSKRILTELYRGGAQYTPWVSNDQLRLYYSEWVGSECFIMMADRSSTDEAWTHVRTFDEIFVEDFWDTNPTLTPDELMIFWNKTGGPENRHAWVATRSSIEEPFTNMTELTELYNATDGTVAGLHILPDTLTIYFSSKHETPEASIYKATRSSTEEPFGNLEVLEFCEPDKRESSPYVTPDEKNIYYRGYTTGLWGIYFIHQLETPYEAAIRNIEEAIEEKTEAIGVIDAAIDKETAALEALGELRASGEYEELGLRRLDIFRARTKIMLSMLRQRRAKAELRKGIRELEQALELLGIEPEVEPQPSMATRSRNGR